MAGIRSPRVSCACKGEQGAPWPGERPASRKVVVSSLHLQTRRKGIMLSVARPPAARATGNAPGASLLHHPHYEMYTHTTRLTWEAQDTELSTWGRRAAPRRAGRGRCATMIAAGSHPLAGVAGSIQELSLLQDGKRRGGRETRYGSGDMYAVG